MALAYLIAAMLLASVDLCLSQATEARAAAVLSSLSPQQLDVDLSQFIPKFNITDPQFLPCKRPKPHNYPTKLKMPRYKVTRSASSGT